MKKPASIFATMLLAGATLCLSIPEAGNAAAFMKLGDIKGEATDSEHKEWIELLSVGVEEPAKDRSRGDTTLGDVVVVRELDKSSTKLLEAINEILEDSNGLTLVNKDDGEGEGGEELDFAALFVEAKRNGGQLDELFISVKAGQGERATYLKYELKNVLVTSYSYHGGGADGAPPTEQISLNFETIKWTYDKQE